MPNATAKTEFADKAKAASATQVADDAALIAQAAAEAKAAADAKSADEWKAKAEAASVELDGLHDLLQEQRDQIEHLEAALQSKGNALEHSAE